jgi:hypothetical protein
MLNNKIFLSVVGPVVFAGVLFLGNQVYATNLAHTTFERYYEYRGCTELLDRTDTYGDCKLADGKTIRLVLINDKWYLEGDGPGVW